MERLHILDGYGYIYRAHYGMATGGRGVRLSTSGGMPTGALYVYASMLIRLHLDVRPERIAVVFDAPGQTFRNELDAEYKKTRSPAPDDLVVQMPYFRPLTEAFSWPVIAIPGVEADDIIATLVRRARERDWEVTILAADKDLMQLVEPHVTVFDAMRQRTFDIAGVTEKFGVGPAQMADWLSLVGDSSDNIPGMPGVGKVNATKLLSRFGSIDAIVENAGEIKGKMGERFRDPENLERLQLSRQLVKLRTDIDISIELDDLRPRPWDSERITDLFSELEFEVLLERLGPTTPPPADETAAGDPLEPAVVASDAVAIAALAERLRAAGRFGLEVQADGGRHDRARAVGIGVFAAGGPPAYVPLRHRYLGAPPEPDAAALAPLAEVIADPEIAVVCHDGKAVRKLLGRDGIELAGVVEDSLVGAYLVDASSTDYSLEKVTEELLGLELTTQRQLCGGGKRATPIEAIEVEAVAGLVAHRAAAASQVTRRLAARLERAHLVPLYRELELPLAELLARIEQVGIELDAAYLGELSIRVGAEIAALEEKVYALAGEPFNLGSPKQLAALLFERLGLTSDRMRKTKTGYSTDHDVLEAMRGEHPIIAPILEHRELIKLKGTYIDALPPLINPASGRLHTEFRQAVTATGRISSTDPNLQNIPIRSELGRQIRRAFVAGRDKLLVSADYSQIELRVLAHLSGDPTLRRAFAARTDVHAQTAAEVFDVPLAGVTSDQRRVAKAVNYGLAYGQSDFGLSRALDISVAEARGYIDRYFARFSSVQGYMDRVIGEARKRGHATTLLGRRRPIPELGSRSWRQRSAAERIAQNTPIQGSAADIMKLAMLRVDELLAERGWDAELLLTVHDELVFEVADDQAESLGAAVAAEMEVAYELEVPLEVEIGISETWAGAH
jgi:DNA polymerase-1